MLDLLTTPSKQTIGIIGSGNIGGALARAFTRAGHRVVIANSRGPATLGTLVTELDDEVLTPSEYVAQHFAGARVVKAFNHIPALDIAEHAQSAGTPERRGLMVYGEDAAAVKRVEALIEEIGFDDVYGGGLAESWRIQRHSGLRTPLPHLGTGRETLSCPALQRDMILALAC